MLVTGVDIIEIERIGKIVNRYKHRFLNRIYTPQELSYCNNRVNQLSTRFAAKEAVMKALGTGTKVNWKDIEVRNNNLGKPILTLHNKAAKILNQISYKNIRIEVSLSDEKNYAISNVIIFNE